MNLLKRCFIQRFSVFDVLVYTTLNMMYAVDAITWLEMLGCVLVSSIISVAAENHLGVRELNGNSQVS